MSMSCRSRRLRVELSVMLVLLETVSGMMVVMSAKSYNIIKISLCPGS